jgi:hypothetical protein
VLVLDMIVILPPLGKYKYDTWRILPVKCYIDNFVRLWSSIRNINKLHVSICSMHVDHLETHLETHGQQEYPQDSEQ